jgi:hypothetical protein
MHLDIEAALPQIGDDLVDLPVATLGMPVHKQERASRAKAFNDTAGFGLMPSGDGHGIP